MRPLRHLLRPGDETGWDLESRPVGTSRADFLGPGEQTFWDLESRPVGT